MNALQHNNIGLFFGSFNPVHIGHMVIANFMLEFTDLDEVWFLISPQNPFKTRENLLADNHRYYMVNLAVEDNFRLKASNFEFHLPKPSYTINTLTYLKEKYPQKHFVILAGSDILPTLDKWKNYEKILEQYDLYIYPRPDTKPHPYLNHPRIKFVNAPLMDISSSFIRAAIKEGRNVSFLLSQKVYNYITEMHFYED
jgi:nicotinate-nucleotide adenylyltransferase